MANEEEKKSIPENLKYFLGNYTDSLLDELISAGVIKKISNPSGEEESAYQLTSEARENIASSEELQSKISTQIQSYYDFRNLIRNVYYYLKQPDSETSREIPLSELLNRFDKLGASVGTWQKINQLKNILDKGDKLLDDEEIQKSAIELFEKNKIDFTAITISVLEFFTMRKLQEHFKGFDFGSQPPDSVSAPHFDIIGTNPKVDFDILIEIKYRKRNTSFKDWLLQGIENLNRYDAINKKNNQLLIILFNHDDASGIEKLKYKFNDNLQSIPAGYIERIHFIPSPINYLNLFDDELKVFKDGVDLQKNLTIDFVDEPRLVQEQESYKIRADFLKSSIGLFSAWVLLKPVSQFYLRPMNNIYVVGHDTNNGATKPQVGNKSWRYENAWGLCITPNKFDSERTGAPTKVNWRLWFSNNQCDVYSYQGPQLTNDTEQWQHVLVRWNHNNPSLEMFINGRPAGVMIDYLDFWPNQINEEAVLGNWMNLHNAHHLNMSLYRVIRIENYVNDSWIENELKQRPVDPFPR